MGEERMITVPLGLESGDVGVYGEVCHGCGQPHVDLSFVSGNGVTAHVTPMDRDSLTHLIHFLHNLRDELCNMATCSQGPEDE